MPIHPSIWVVHQFKIMATIVAAYDRNHLIGNGANIPWLGELPADMKHFRKLTLESAVLMGRLTFESIGKPLPRRKNMVLTRDKNWQSPGVETIHSSAELVRLIEAEEKLFIIGGRQVYILALPHTDVLELTAIHAEFEGDVFFPPIDEAEWQLVSREDHIADGVNKYDYSFLRYERV